MSVYSQDDLQQFIYKTLHKAGYNLEESIAISQSLVLAQLMGYESHGLIRLISYCENLQKGYVHSGKNLQRLQESNSHYVYDGGYGVGQLYMAQIIQEIESIMPQKAIFCISLAHSSHLGRIGEWTQKIASLGYMALMVVNDNGFKAVAPVGGKQACFSTNPIAFSCAYGQDDIFTMDISTSAMSLGKARSAWLKGELCPPYTLQNHQGMLTQNPQDILTPPYGTLLPLGGVLGHKGMALVMMVDFLASGLSGGHFPLNQDAPNASNNMTLTVWNPHLFSGNAGFAERAKAYVEFIISSDVIDAEKPIRVAGQGSQKRYHDSLQQGVTLPQELVKQVNEFAMSIGQVDILAAK